MNKNEISKLQIMNNFFALRAFGTHKYAPSNFAPSIHLPNSVPSTYFFFNPISSLLHRPDIIHIFFHDKWCLKAKPSNPFRIFFSFKNVLLKKLQNLDALHEKTSAPPTTNMQPPGD